MEPTPTRGGIFLRLDRFEDFMGELVLLSIEGQARQLGMPSMNLRRARAGMRLGDRAIVDLMAGMGRIAQRRRTRAPEFGDLFEIRLPATVAA